MLLARVAAEIRANDELARRLLPVRFMEESQEIFNMADFWLEALFHLARESAPHDSELAEELRTTHADLSAHWGDRSLEDRARAAVLGAADRLDKKLVLMVENLQSICESVDADFGWKLRGALQSEPKMMLLASATSRFESLDDAEQPFFELFRNICLEPLTTEECRLLWQAVSGDEVSGREIRPLQILTGGSPRLLVIVAGFARHHSLRQLMEELVTLIDEHTEYFRSHLEVLAKTERRVYLAVIDLWRPSSTAEIAARARMDVRTVSTMLGRLVERGAIIVEGSGRKRFYAAAERLYSIYYKLRRERDEAAIVENLIRFMVMFYNEEEQAEMFYKLDKEAAKSPLIREGIKRVLHHLRIELQAKFETVKEINIALKMKAFEKVIETADQTLASPVASSSEFSDSDEAFLRHAKVSSYLGMGDFNAAITECNEILERFGNNDEPELQCWVAVTLINKGKARENLGNFERAIEAYDEVVKRFGKTNDTNLQVIVSNALLDKGNSLIKHGEFSRAIAPCNEILQRFGDINMPVIQEQVAGALLYKGIALGKLDDFMGAIEAYDELIERYVDNNAHDIQRWVIVALSEKSMHETQIGSADEALRTCGELERSLVNFSGEMKHWFVWRILCVRTKALLLKENLQDAMDAFGSAYAALPANTEFTTHEMLRLIPDLIVVGATSHELVEILMSDEEKSGFLAPLIVALRQIAGEEVRAPAEVLEVAADIRERIEKKAAKDVSGSYRPLE
ncbi:MAG: tetratricopeptide repeat protein [Nitrospinae bacterium]|nr:tetratricopeptide repeat protein [Nitrospinota bacterium]